MSWRWRWRGRWGRGCRGSARCWPPHVIDYVKAKIVAGELSVLDGEHAARAEALIAGQLAGKTPGQAGKLAAAAVVDVDPAGAQKRREQAERENARGGRTCACNAGARSRRCHKVKQSTGWSVSQPQPGWHQWTTPSGRTYTQEPMKYPA